MTRATSSPPALYQEAALRVVLGLLVGLVALLFLRSPGTSDVPLFMRWMDNVDRLGVVEGYAANQTAHPPLYAVIFWLVAKLADGLAVSHFIAYKLSLLLAWVLTGVCLWQWTHSAVTITAVLLALIPNSLALGYFDVYLMPLLLSALWAARQQRWVLFSTSFTLMALTKAQGLILVPFAVVFAAAVALREPRTRERTLRVAVGLAAPAVLIGMLFLAVFGGAMIGALHYAANNELFSGNALNLCWVITHYLRWARPERFGGLLADGTAQFIAIPATDPLRSWMRVAFFAAFGLILVLYARRATSLQDFVYYSLLGFLAYFMLNTGVHENHLVYAAILSTVLFLIDGSYLLHAVVCWLATNANMILFYGLRGGGLPFSRVVGVDLALPLACLNVIFFAVAMTPILAPVRRNAA